MVDTGGEVSTQEFDRSKARAVALANEDKLKIALSLLRKGFNLGDSLAVAQAATISAAVNQAVIFKPVFEDLVLGTKDFGGLGVNCAHTGTVLGVMFDPLTTEVEMLKERVKALIGRMPIMGVYPLIAGGRYF